MSLLVVGSVAFDTLTTPFGRREKILGGSATYFSLSARFFSPVKLVAVVGNDFPKKYIKLFEDKGVDLKGLEVARGKTFHWEGEYDWDFNAKTISTSLNVFADFNPKIPDEYKDSEYVFLANIDPDLQSRVLSQVKNPKLVACDTMNHWIASKQKSLIKFLKKIDIFFLNDSEARQLSGQKNLVKAAKYIMKFGPKRIIIKKGEHGSLLFSKDSVFSVPAFLLEEVYDPTGAGDTFAGAVMGYLAKCNRLNEKNLRNAIIYGNIMATFTVEEFGPWRLERVKRPEIEKRVKEFKNLTCF
jgi:sugar/nucleoside kinase (ribokinase family)